MGNDQKSDELSNFKTYCYRFKGQAADAVVITEVDFESLDARSKRLLFVGLSRARLQTKLVVSERACDLLLNQLQ
ncbi:MAG: hypothetical protein EB116_10100 [Betaproteobacteria bacterium]|nr:hypothetical protein [Betaproteobacteria bacterium]